MRAARFWTVLLPILLFALALRLSGVAWDGGIGAHPDERYLVGLAESLRWPDQLDPLALEPGFAYGHLPLYLLMLLGGADRLLAARLLTGLVDVGTVSLTAALGRRLAGGRVGLLAAAFVAVMPLHVQQAHFATVDALLAFFVTGALLLAVRLAERGGWVDALLAGLWAGLAVGCKAAAALLALPLAAAWAVAPLSARARAARAAATTGAALLALVLTNPFAMFDAPAFLAALAAQGAMVRGAALLPYTLQYHGTLPYLYPLAQQLIWGMGPLLGLLCFAGCGAALWRAARGALPPAAWVVLAWAMPFFAFTGGLFAKFPRYLLPLTPLLAVYGAQWVVRDGCLGGPTGPSRKFSRFRVLLCSSVALFPTALLSLALVASYNRPHPWVAASTWLRAHIPPGAVVAVEAWDHPLPVDASGYELRTLPVFAEEMADKWAVMEQILAETDVVVIASRRGYGALTRWPERFPRTAAYYRELLAGERGFALAACFDRWPRLGPFTLADDPLRAAGLPGWDSVCRPLPPVLRLPRLDESFVVYDHPQVFILLRRKD